MTINTATKHSLPPPSEGPPLKRGRPDNSLSLLERLPDDWIRHIASFLYMPEAASLSSTSNRFQCLHRSLFQHAWISSLSNPVFRKGKFHQKSGSAIRECFMDKFSKLSTLPNLRTLVIENNKIELGDQMDKTTFRRKDLEVLVLDHFQVLGLPEKWMSQFTSLSRFDITGAHLSNSWLYPFIKNQNRLKGISFETCIFYTPFSERVEPLPNLKTLKKLRVCDCEFKRYPQDTGSSHLIIDISKAAECLTHLELKGNFHPEEIIATAQNSPELTHLSISNISIDTLTQISKSCRKITHLTLIQSEYLLDNDRFLETITEMFLKLQHLNLKKIEKRPYLPASSIYDSDDDEYHCVRNVKTFKEKALSFQKPGLTVVLPLSPERHLNEPTQL